MKYDRVLQDAEEVLHILAPIERIVELKDNRTLFMRITPYKTSENVIDGVVIDFSDITEQAGNAGRDVPGHLRENPQRPSRL